jgi:hypothetical protein
MFEQLFEQPHALARHRAGPLLEERLRYLTHRASQGLARKSLRVVAADLLTITDYLRLADCPGQVIPYTEIEEGATLWADRPQKPTRAKGTKRIRQRFLWHATQWLEFLGRLHRQPLHQVRSMV